MAKRRVLPGCCLAVVVATVTVVLPYWVMRPFRPQGPGELAVALATLRLAPWLLAGAAALAVWMLVRAVPRAPRFTWARRISGALALVIVLGLAGASRINLFEQMFAPLRGPSFAAVAGAPLPADDVVMAVTLAGAARAYPVRIMAYHHVLDDTVGDTPIVVTY